MLGCSSVGGSTISLIITLYVRHETETKTIRFIMVENDTYERMISDGLDWKSSWSKGGIETRGGPRIGEQTTMQSRR